MAQKVHAREVYQLSSRIFQRYALAVWPLALVVVAPSLLSTAAPDMYVAGWLSSSPWPAVALIAIGYPVSVAGSAAVCSVLVMRATAGERGEAFSLGDAVRATFAKPLRLLLSGVVAFVAPVVVPMVVVGRAFFVLGGGPSVPAAWSGAAVAGAVASALFFFLYGCRFMAVAGVAMPRNLTIGAATRRALELTRVNMVAVIVGTIGSCLVVAFIGWGVAVGAFSASGTEIPMDGSVVLLPVGWRVATRALVAPFVQLYLMSLVAAWVIRFEQALEPEAVAAPVDVGATAPAGSQADGGLR